MSDTPSTPGIASSTAWNIAGQVVPAVVIVCCLPILMLQLGAEQFGLFTILWSGWVALTHADFGLGRATVWAVSRKANSSDDLSTVVWTSLAVHFLLGTVASLCLVHCIPVLSESLVPTEHLIRKFEHACLWIAVSIPFLVLRVSLVGYLEGTHRFSFVNCVRIPTSIGTYVAPVLLCTFNNSLTFAVAGMAIVRIASVIVLAILLMSSQAVFRQPRLPKASVLRPMVGMAGGLCITTLIVVLQPPLERGILGSYCGPSVVTAFVIPYEMVTRLWIVSGALLTTLFPRFSREGCSLVSHVKDLTRGVLVLLSVGTIGAVALLLAGPSVVWLLLDPFLRSDAQLVSTLLSMAILVHVVIAAPATWLQAQQKTWQVSAVYSASTIIYLLAILLIVPNAGAVGLACLWTTKVILEAMLLCCILRPSLAELFRARYLRVLVSRFTESFCFVMLAMLLSLFGCHNPLLLAAISPAFMGAVGYRALGVWLTSSDRRATKERVRALSLRVLKGVLGRPQVAMSTEQSFRLEQRL